MKYTKGPWKIYGREGKLKCYITDTDGRAIADFDSFCSAHTSRENLEANVHLAAAAPDMYEALIKIKKWAESANDYLTQEGYGVGAISDIIRISDDLIDQAEGK